MFENVREDLRHYCRFCFPGRGLLSSLPRLVFAHPACVAVLWYRFGAAAWRCPVPGLRHLWKAVYVLFMPIVRMYAGVQIQPNTQIGPGLAILHFGGVVITKDCVIGPNCLLHHNVNIVTMKSSRGPRIGANLYVGVGATLIGDLVIEDNVTIGAGSVVTRSVPHDAIVAGIPAKILRFRREGENNADNQTGRRTVIQWMEAPAGAAPPVEQTVPSHS